ncbi:hypothetical protein AXG93_2632s1030 [Marchantia polymorpha subsp. ruderalis]|uniref:Uncharacterized protein n=1 Tax=Marchantia polymorpha subsp. ruderalis TaxID=1480154 RepID=A0A176VWC4_MARPO|nr:hypothetical protein AXG93_2632s1030 [Marchantia polymorpha subsp. ruderalis]
MATPPSLSSNVQHEPRTTESVAETMEVHPWSIQVQAIARPNSPSPPVDFPIPGQSTSGRREATANPPPAFSSAPIPAPLLSERGPRTGTGTKGSTDKEGHDRTGIRHHAGAGSSGSGGSRADSEGGKGSELVTAAAAVVGFKYSRRPSSPSVRSDRQNWRAAFSHALDLDRDPPIRGAIERGGRAGRMGAILSSRSSHSPPGPKNGLIYCFVARGTGPGVVVLAEYKPLEGNFHKIGLECAKKLAAKNHSITYTCNHTITYTCDHSTTVTCEQHTFNFLVKDKFTYLVVAEESFPREIPLAFLVRMKDDFREKFPDAYKAKMKAHSLDKRFRPIMKKHVTFCVQHHLERLDQVANIQNQLEEVKALLRTNIYKVMDRHERLEVVVEKAEILANLAEQYRENTNTLRKKFWWQNMKISQKFYRFF